MGSQKSARQCKITTRYPPSDEARMPTSSLFFGDLVPLLPRLLHHLRNPFATRSISPAPPDQPNIETRQDVIATRQLATFVDSTISGTTLRNTSFMSCTLNRVEIHGSIISNSNLSNCRLSNCVIDCSSIIDSKLHETKIFDCSMRNSTTTLSPLALRKFPPEVRAMIFEDCLVINDEECLTMDESTYPALLSALKCDRGMFREAMDILPKVNWHCLCLQNLPYFKTTPSKEIESIRKLNISTRFKKRLEAGIFPPRFEQCNLVKQVFLVPYDAPEQIIWTKACIAKFQTMVSLKIKIPSKYRVSQAHHRSNAQIDAMFTLEKNIGAPARLDSVATGEWEVWFWEAPRGQTLTWKD